MIAALDGEITARMGQIEARGSLKDMDGKEEGWLERKKLYYDLAIKGDVEALKERVSRQIEKAEKAKAGKKKKEKSLEYIAYKERKIEFTKRLLSLAKLVVQMKERKYKIELKSIQNQLKKEKKALREPLRWD